MFSSTGTDDIEGGNNEDIGEVRGKTVNTVFGYAPIEAWAKALSKLGLIDEIVYEQALKSLEDARVEGLAELEDKSSTVKKVKSDSKTHQNGNKKQGDSEDSEEKKNADDNTSVNDDDKEIFSEKEEQLRKNLIELSNEYETVLSDSRETSLALAEMRIKALGPFLSNPFLNSDASLNQQKQWLSTIVKKEKSKIGSTGNKRKIITATDLLERTASFYNTDIEKLIEGLPGSEFCPAYAFHELRASGASALNWIHEEQTRQGKEKYKKKKRIHEEKAKVQQNKENKMKRKAKEEEEEARKKQKLEELDLQKKERELNRLTRLTAQIDEKLFKESLIQRERITFLGTKLMGKEISRRRKAAETIVSYNIGNNHEVDIEKKADVDNISSLSQIYHSDVVRLWNFMNVYRGAFDPDSTCIPGLDQLQDAVNCLNSKNSENSLRNKAINFFTDIAIELCEPLSKGLIKTLSSALASTLQNDNESKSDNGSDIDPDFLPIISSTWREIARHIFLSDALSELGYTKIEQTHILRGHRTGGHPNSKEAKRVKRGEDHAIVLRRQDLIQSKDAKQKGIKVQISVPCQPSAQPSDWSFYLHNIQSLPLTAATSIKSNLENAYSLIKKRNHETNQSENDNIMSTLQQNISLLEEIGTSGISSSESVQICKNVRQNVLQLLNEQKQEEFIAVKKPKKAASTASQVQSMRLKVGLYNELNLSAEGYKQHQAAKKQYMSVAMKVTEDLLRKKKRAEGEEDVDDDDDDDDDDDENQNTAKEDVEAINNDQGRIGKKTEYDDFCADEPSAPELIRRCLAVLRCVCLTTLAENFIYPVDPRGNMKYYEAVMNPMSLYDVGKKLQRIAKQSQGTEQSINLIENAVVQFGRDVRLIRHNCTVYSTVGAAIISTAEEMLRIFERLFFDWVLCPEKIRPPLDMLDDDRCVEFHPSDEESMVLLCDGCEGKFNMSRLNPPLTRVPKGDWYCPRCRSGYCWASVDPRIGQKVEKPDHDQASSHEFGIVNNCFSYFPEDENDKVSFRYVVAFKSGLEEIWSLDEVDNALKKMGKPVQQIQCLKAVAESSGYGRGVERKLINETVPIPLNPYVSDAAAQQFVKSSVFQDELISSAVLYLNDLESISASEWLKILVLLAMKSATTDKIQEFSSKLENEANAKANEKISKESNLKPISDIIPKVTDDEYENGDEYEILKDEETNYKIDSSNMEIIRPDDKTTMEMDVSDNKTEKKMDSSDDKDNKASEAQLLAKQKRKEVFTSMKERQKARENGFMTSCIQASIKPAIASFEEDHVTQVIDSYLSRNKLDGVDLSSSQCRSITCDLCGLSDMALATPLVRVPNHQEWLERMTYSCSNHRSYLAAEVGIAKNFSSQEILTSNNENDLKPDLKTAEIEDIPNKDHSKLVIVTVRVDGDIVSAKDHNLSLNSDEVEIMSFLPVNQKGFQRELNCRCNDDLPFTTGSLRAHECCALAAHKARIDRVIQDEKEESAASIDKLFGNSCGRTLSLGSDGNGKLYWKLESEPKSLFVSVQNDEHFRKFGAPETIASLIKGLGKHPLASVIRNAYPDAAKVLSDGTWSNLILKNAFNNMFDPQHKEKEIKEIEDISDSEIDEVRYLCFFLRLFMCFK